MRCVSRKVAIGVALLAVVLAVGLAGHHRRESNLPAPLAKLVRDIQAQMPWYYRAMEQTDTLRFLPKKWAPRLNADFDLSGKRQTAANRLGGLGTNAWPAVPVLLNALKDRNLGIGVMAAEALAGMKADEYPEWARLQSVLADNRNAAWVLHYLLVGGTSSGPRYSSPYRRFALIGLAATESAAGIAYTDAVEIVKFSAENELRALALGVVAKVKSQRQQSVPLLRSVLQNSEEWPEVSAAAALALVVAAPKEAETREVLHRALQDPRSQVRLAAARALWKLKAPAGEVLPVLTSLLSHKLPRIRSGALDGLRELGQAAQPSRSEVERLRFDDNEKVRCSAEAAWKSLAGESEPSRSAAFTPLHAAKAGAR